MEDLDGVWRLVDSRAWLAGSDRLSAPYGANPMGTLVFSKGRVVTVVCNGEAEAAPGRNFSSYGGPYTFDGKMLVTHVDVASDPTRIGGRQEREVVMMGEQMLLRPPERRYGESVERRELVWERVWRPGGKDKAPSGGPNK